MVCAQSRMCQSPPVSDSRDWQIATALLRLTTQLVDGIQEGLVEAGFTDVRPAHGFAFVRISQGPTSIAGLAEHLSITKQAASQLVAQLDDRGYITRRLDPNDSRAQLLALTPRGQACVSAAQRAGSSTVHRWCRQLPQEDVTRLAETLAALVEPGPLRPSW